MSTPQRRQRFQPSIAGTLGIDSANAGFRREAAAFALRWRCDDCAYFRPSDAACSVGWPNQQLVAADDALDGAGIPVFCKAFEDVNG